MDTVLAIDVESNKYYTKYQVASALEIPVSTFQNWLNEHKAKDEEIKIG